MRKLISYDKIKSEKDFWLMFLMGNFPESLDNETDETFLMMRIKMESNKLLLMV